jgi:hypothetical protein
LGYNSTSKNEDTSLFFMIKDFKPGENVAVMLNIEWASSRFHLVLDEDWSVYPEEEVLVIDGMDFDIIKID